MNDQKSALRDRVNRAVGRLDGKTVQITPAALEGEVRVPPSKSVTHRALICAALSKSKCRVENPLLSDDTIATAACLRILGAGFSGDTIDGSGFLKRGGILPCGESGSTLRFMMPLSCLANDVCVLNGEGRLLKRPVQPLADALNELGGKVSTANGFAPVSTRPGLSGGTCHLPGDVSSQFVSGLLMALPLCTKPSEIRIEGKLESGPYVELTLDVMRHFGVSVEETENGYSVQPRPYRAKSFNVPGDWSSAAFWLVAGALGGGVTVENVVPDKQADSAIVKLLQKMGGKPNLTKDAGTTSNRSKLTGTDIDVSDCPDLVPILAVAGCFASGKTRLYNAARLRLKESDRLAAMACELRKMGANVEEKPDELLIHQSALTGAPNLESHDDHRIAMALGVAATLAEGSSSLAHSDCVAKSYPSFFNDLKKLGGHVL